MTSTAQHPFMVRDDLARIFSLPLSRVRVGVPYIGGGYGSKSYTKVEPLAAVGAWCSRRPVKLVLDVEEAIYTTRADPAVVPRAERVRRGRHDPRPRVRHGDGFRRVRGQLAAGAGKAINRCFGPYRVPNLRVRGRSIYTNTSPASSCADSAPRRAISPGETNLDRAAEQLGIGPAGHQAAQPGRRRRGDPARQARPGRRHQGRPGAGRRVAGAGPEVGAAARDRLRLLRLRRRRVPDLDGAGADPDRRVGRHCERVDRDGPGQPVGTGPDRRGGARGRPRPGPRRAVRHRRRAPTSAPPAPAAPPRLSGWRSSARAPDARPQLRAMAAEACACRRDRCRGARRGAVDGSRSGSARS